MNKGILSNAAVKNIAYITMFTDHFFAVVYRGIMRQYQMAGYGTAGMEQIYSAGRAVGRISFILFACLAAEGFRHTRSRRNYLLRLGVFALVSEAPFDLAFSGTCYDPGGQNVFFTLFLGVLVLTVWEWLPDRAAHKGALWCGRAGALVLCCLAAYLLHTDYKYMGVLLIVAFYLTSSRMLSVQMIAAGCVMLFGTWSANCLGYADSYSVMYLFRFSLREMYGLFAFIPIAMYNGKKGRQLPKAFCYGFYPAHLLLLHCAAVMIAGGM